MARKLRVLHAYKVYLPDIMGGIPTIIQTLTDGHRKDCDSTVLTTRRLGTPATLRIGAALVRRTLSLGTLMSLPLAPLYPLHLWRLARRADVLVHHAPFPLVDVGIFLGLPKRCGLVIHWHSEIVGQKRARWLVRPFIARALARADRVVVSEQKLIDESPFLRPLADKCEILPYGVDTIYWTHLTSDQEQRVAELRARHPRLVVATGRLVPYKGFEVLIDAFRDVRGECVIIGGGALMEPLRQRIEAHGLGDRVRLLGSVERDELKCWLHAAQVFAFPSVTSAETFGVAQVEAMACGCPVVNTSLATSVPEVARHGREGLTVTPCEVAPLAAAITTLLDDDSLRERLGRQARERAEDTYGEAKFVGKTQDIYRAAAAAHLSSAQGGAR